MNTFKNNRTYFNKKNKFSSNTRMIEENLSSFNMNEYMKSIKDETVYFTNFVKSQGAEKYKSMRTICYKFENDTNTINRDFVVNEIIKDANLLKLKMLIKENTGMDLSVNEIVMNVRKFDYNDDTGIRLYFFKDKSNKMTLILVDLYHLVFPSKNRNYKLDYQRKEDCNYDLKNIYLHS